MIKKNILLIGSLALTIAACTNAKGPIPEAAKVGDCDTANVYDGYIEPIITTNCAISGCHDAGSGMSLVTYNDVKLYVDNGLLKDRALVKKDMPTAPISPLSEAQLARITCWLDNGAKEKGSGSGSSSGTCGTTISYSSDIAPIVAAKCNVSGCHNSGSSYGDFTSYTGLKAFASSGSLNTQVVTLKLMPKFPVLPLTSDQISKIDCWIQQGALNN